METQISQYIHEKFVSGCNFSEEHCGQNVNERFQNSSQKLPEVK